MEQVFKKTRFDSYSPKRVSFILTTKNRPDFLEAVLERTRALVGPEDELIVVDGGSDTPLTFEFAAKFKDLINVFISEPDDSIMHGFNKGVMLSNGKYVKYLFDDDIFNPVAMEEAVAVLEKHPDVDFLICGGEKVNVSTGNRKVVYVRPGVDYGKHPDDVRYGANGIGFFMRRSVFAKVGFATSRYVSDNEFFMQAVAKGANVKFCRINLYENMVYPHSNVLKNRAKWYLESYPIFWQYCSLPFYLRHRLKAFSVEHNLLPIFKLAERFPGRLRRFSKKIMGLKQEKEPHLWDGGFS